MPNNKKIEKILAQVSFAKLFDFELNEANCISINLSDSNKLLLEAKMSNYLIYSNSSLIQLKQKIKLLQLVGIWKKEPFTK